MDIVLVENNPAILSHMVDAISCCEGVSAIHTACTCKKGIEKLKHYSDIGLLVCEIDLPDGSGVALIDYASSMAVPAVVYTSETSAQAIAESIAAGACGYLVKSLSVSELSSALKQALDGGAPLAPSIAAYVLKEYRRASVPANVCSRSEGLDVDSSLTKRESQVLQLVASGYRFSDIADSLSISEHTVSNHNRSIYRKLQVQSRAQAVCKAIKFGLVALEQ